jgi:phosphoribosylformylglycinamidine synthase
VPHAGSRDPHTAAVLLFSESNTRFLCEVPKEHAAAFERALAGVPFGKLGEVIPSADLQVALDGHPVVVVGLDRLKAAWQSPLHWS